VAMVEGPAAGLLLMDELAATGELDGYHLLHAGRADLLRRLGRRPEAAAAYRRALDLTSNPVERAFLTRRLAEVG
jgi:RNA polymerase sigma-70 factor, ECF subfamily